MADPCKQLIKQIASALTTIDSYENYLFMVHQRTRLPGRLDTCAGRAIIRIIITSNTVRVTHAHSHTVQQYTFAPKHFPDTGFAENGTSI